MTDSGAPVPRRLLRAEQVLAGRTRRVSLVLEGSQDPHNVHAVLRTAEALGVQDVHLVAPRGEAANIAPGVTQSAHEWLSVRRHADLEAACTLLREEGRSLLRAANEPGALSLTGLTPDGPVAVVLGNETAGLSSRARELVDGFVRIDLVGFSGSLNLSVSAAIILWELRRREVARERPGDLDAPALARLRDGWYRKLLGKRVRGTAALDDWLERAPEIAAAARAADRLPPRDRRRD
jgi:tRNA (guanosine-2'-O-)-methyltransferase